MNFGLREPPNIGYSSAFQSFWKIIKTNRFSKSLQLGFRDFNTFSYIFTKKVPINNVGTLDSWLFHGIFAGRFLKKFISI